MINTRNIAFNILYKIEKEDAYSNLILNNTLIENNLNKLDSAFVSALVYGVLERQITLDYILRQYSKIPVRKIETRTLIILRLGILQLLFMDKIPESAAVNESVSLAKKKGLVKSSGFINGILRSIARADVKYTLPDEKDFTKHLSVKYSCPEYLINLWQKSYGTENTLKILNSIVGRPPVTIRVNTLKMSKYYVMDMLTSIGITVKEIPFLHDAVNIENSGAIQKLKAFYNGDIYVQDAASQLCVDFLNPQSGDTVLDICSAPGGKAVTAAIKMENKGKILAFDMYEHKLKLINDNARRLGITIISSRIRDGATDENQLPLAQKVLCDVPCSGFGIIRRKPEIRYKKDTNLDNLIELQYRILCNSAKHTAIGGVLIYSTCTLNPAENGNNADRFIKEHLDCFEPLALELPKGIERCIEEPENQLTLMPFMADTDGFFISAFRRLR